MSITATSGRSRTIVSQPAMPSAASATTSKGRLKRGSQTRARERMILDDDDARASSSVIRSPPGGSR